MKVAFFKGTHSGISAVYCVGVRIWTKSKYSHCEIVFNDGTAASSSFKDGGVRFANVDFTDGNWDFIELPDEYEGPAREWFNQHKGLKYDVWGNVHFVVGFVPDSKTKWFCSEAVGAALGLTDSWRYSPGDLYVALKFLSDHLSKKDTV